MAFETTPTLLERQRELAEVDAAIREAGRGRGRVALLDAPAGPRR